jgi:two-component system response regulator VicR
MAHILLVDDDHKLIEPLKAAFENEGYQVSAAYDGRAGLEKALMLQPDVIVLDVMMPELTGWDVCKKIRERSPVPIIMLTALDETMDRVRGLEIGADDYLVKPFEFRALHAHIRAMLRRVNLNSRDHATFSVFKAGEEIKLRQKEFDILVLLMTNNDHVVTRNELFDEVWGTDWLGDTRTLDVHMSWLRNKLEADPSNPTYFQTVRGVGYRFMMPVTRGR